MDRGTLCVYVCHRHGLIVFWLSHCNSSILPQVGSRLPNEVARLVKAHSVTFGIAHSLTNAGVVGLTRVAVLCWTSEALNGFLFEFWY